MSVWQNRDVQLRLSPPGRQALVGILDTPVVDVSIQWADDLGLWALLAPANGPEVTVFLIRWEHFETAIMSVVLEKPRPSNVTGFDVWQRKAKP